MCSVPTVNCKEKKKKLSPQTLVKILGKSLETVQFLHTSNIPYYWICLLLFSAQINKRIPTTVLKLDPAGTKNAL